MKRRVTSCHGMSPDDARDRDWARMHALLMTYREVAATFERFQEKPNCVRNRKMLTAIVDYVELRERWRAELEEDGQRIRLAAIPKLCQRINRLTQEFEMSQPDSIGCVAPLPPPKG